MNICRLPREEAFSLAYKMAELNPGKEPFARFADFENYYPRRMEADERLRSRFASLGGKPDEAHPLFFVLHGSGTLEKWFGDWISRRILLKDIPSECISFTLNDSLLSLGKEGKLTMYTKEALSHKLREYDTIEEFLNELTKQYYCIEAQLWNDDYCV